MTTPQHSGRPGSAAGHTRGSTSSRRTRGTSNPTASGTRTLRTGDHPPAARSALAEFVAWLVRGGDQARAAVVAFFRRLSQVITPLGWVALVGAPVALITGFALGWTELVAVGWAFLALAIIAFLYLIGRPRIEISLDLPHRRVTAGEPASGRIVGRNPHGTRSVAATVEIPIGDRLAELVLPGIAANAEHAVEFGLPTERRGVIAVGPVRTVRGDPIGLVRRELVWAEPEELIIHPRTIAAPSTSTGVVHDLEGAPTRSLSVSDLAFHALREYQPGDERRYIHWKSSAKTGTYMVRQFEQSRRSHLAVALSLAPGDYRDAEEFELAVSAAASLGVRAIRDARTVSVVVGQTIPGGVGRRPLPAMRTLATHRPDRLLDDLARVEQIPDAPGIRALARSVAEELSHVSLAFLVSGANVPAQQLRAAAHSFPLDVRVVAVVCDPESEPGPKVVGGVDVLTIGLLDDLRQVLARTAAVS